MRLSDVTRDNRKNVKINAIRLKPYQKAKIIFLRPYAPHNVRSQKTKKNAFLHPS